MVATSGGWCGTKLGQFWFHTQKHRFAFRLLNNNTSFHFSYRLMIIIILNQPRRQPGSSHPPFVPGAARSWIFVTLSSVVAVFGAPGRGSSKTDVRPRWNHFWRSPSREKSHRIQHPSALWYRSAISLPKTRIESQNESPNALKTKLRVRFGWNFDSSRIRECITR